MTAGKSVKSWYSRFKLAPLAVSCLLALATFITMLLVKHGGLFQPLEFWAYDSFLRNQPKASSSEPIVLIEMTEKDIQDPALDYPIYDEKLAELLRAVAAGQPIVIGLDIWRDIPVPKNGGGLPQLNDVLKTHTNIVPIFTLDGIAPPTVLGLDPSRVAFNDNFPVDVMVDHTVPKVRRTMLFGDSADGESFYSLPFFVALHYLQSKGIEPEMDPQDANLIRLGKASLRKFHSTDGAYVQADDRGWQMLLDFRCPENFSRFTVTDALSGKIPARNLKDKIVLIGINTVSVQDVRVTPMRRDHRGIEVQALTVNQLLRLALGGEKSLKSWTDWQEDLLIFVWCVLGCVIGYRISSSWFFAIESITCLAVIAGAAWLSFSRGWWIPLAAPAVAYATTAFLVTSYITSQEREMRAILMKLYSRHVSKEIAEDIWENRDSFLDGNRPLAQKLVVTVLFTDLKGFSTISERMEPPHLYGWLNGYLGAMAQVVVGHGGVLKQFTGDGILALFGVPVPHTTALAQESDAAAAVRCALAMGTRLVQLSREWQEAGLPLVSMRAGIYTGEVAAGSVGSDDRFEYAVIGDVVNTAARLESYDKKLADPDLLPNRCRILIGEPTQRLLKDKFMTQQIGLLEVKGKANKVSVFLVEREKSLNDPVAVTSSDRENTRLDAGPITT